MRGSRRAWAWIALLVVVACESPRPSPTPPQAEPTPGPSSTAAAAATPAAATPAPTPSPRPPSALDLINDASESGAIDTATAYLYRLYAQWGDGRLPFEYQGRRENDHTLVITAADAFESLSAEEQAVVLPVVVRPTHEASYWADLPQAATAARSNVGLVRVLAPDPRCGEAGWSRADVPQLPVTVWGRCAVDGRGDYQFTIGGDMNRVALAITALWGPMTGLMGKPIPDEFAGPLRSLAEVEEAGDGRLDIYLVYGPNQPYGRDLLSPSRAPAMAVSAPEHRGGARSGYIVIDAFQNRAPFELESSLAHEFFHVLQFAHEYEGMLACPYPSTTLSCPATDRGFHWFMEASASWAEHEFVPDGRPVVAHERWERFSGTDRSLMRTDGENEYLSYMWPLFMEQEHPLGPAAIAATWQALEGKSGWIAVQAAIDSQLPFETSFRDFAVRVWNEELLPGDPLGRRFQAQSLDPSFPVTRPEEAVPEHPRYKGELNLELDVPARQTVDLPELWAAYYKVNLLAGAHRLTLNFAGLTPNGKLDVDALVKIRDLGWQRRELDPVLTEICLDKPGDAIEEMILVLSNHSQTPLEHIKGDWTAEAEVAGCLTGSDSLTFSLVQTIGAADSDYYSYVKQSLQLQVSLKSNPDYTLGADFLNAGSTYQAAFEAQSSIRGLAGCDTVTAGHGGDSGAVQGDDGITGSLQQVFYPVPGGQVGPEGRWILAIAATVPVEVTSSIMSCGGSSSEISTQTISLMPCDGDEINDTDPARIFDFHCVFQAPGYTWSVIGKVRLGT